MLTVRLTADDAHWLVWHLASGSSHPDALRIARLIREQTCPESPQETYCAPHEHCGRGD